MSTFKHFEDIETWQLARSFCQGIFKITLYKQFARDYKLIDQIRASSGSIMDNIAERFERGGNKEFVNFLSYAKASCAESRSQLYRVLDQNYIEEIEFRKLYDQANLIGKKIGSLMKYLKNSQLKGVKYK